MNGITRALLAAALAGIAGVAAQPALAASTASSTAPETPTSTSTSTSTSTPTSPPASTVRPAAVVVDRACDASVRPTPLDGTGADPQPDVEPPSIATSDPQVRDLGRSRDRVILRTTLQLSKPLPKGTEYLNVSVGPFQRSDGRALETPQVVATARVDQNGRRKTVDLSVCVDPEMPDPVVKGQTIETAAGSYTGTVAIDDPRVAGGAATHTLNLQYESWKRVAVASVVAFLVGAAVGLVLASGVTWAGLKAKKNRTRAFTAVVAGIGASYAVYATLYAADPAWRGDSVAFTALVVGIIGAAYTASNFAGSVARSETPPDPAH